MKPMWLPIAFQLKTAKFSTENNIGRTASALSILYILCGRVFHISVRVLGGTSTEYDWRVLFLWCKSTLTNLPAFHIP
jgi:hypothetical protein